MMQGSVPVSAGGLHRVKGTHHPSIELPPHMMATPSHYQGLDDLLLSVR